MKKALMRLIKYIYSRRIKYDDCDTRQRIVIIDGRYYAYDIWL